MRNISTIQKNTRYLKWKNTLYYGMLIAQNKNAGINRLMKKNYSFSYVLLS